MWKCPSIGRLVIKQAIAFCFHCVSLWVLQSASMIALWPLTSYYVHVHTCEAINLHIWEPLGLFICVSYGGHWPAMCTDLWWPLACYVYRPVVAITLLHVCVQTCGGHYPAMCTDLWWPLPCYVYRPVVAITLLCVQTCGGH